MTEKGYLIVNGPVLDGVEISKDGIILENNHTINFNSISFVLYKEILYFSISYLKAWGKFSRKTYLRMSEYIEEDDNGFYFILHDKDLLNVKIIQREKIDWINSQ